jgi:hypothetical protein
LKRLNVDRFERSADLRHGDGGGGGYTLRQIEKSAEVFDKQGVAREPLRKRVRNLLKRKDLNESGAEMKNVQGERVEIGEWHFGAECKHFEAQCKQTRERIAEDVAAVNSSFDSVRMGA